MVIAKFFQFLTKLKSTTLRALLFARVIDGIWIGSDELKERVMLSPGLAKAWESLALVETRVIHQGWSSSIKNHLGVIVRALTGEPLLPARSSTSMLKEALAFCPSRTVPLTSHCLPSVSILLNSRVSRPLMLIRIGRSLDRFGGLETQGDLIIFPGGGIIQVIEMIETSRSSVSSCRYQQNWSRWCCPR